jgi:anti-sigma regulatory factor (Ser/Thr protein kinase)
VASAPRRKWVIPVTHPDRGPTYVALELLARLDLPARPDEVAPARHWLTKLLAADHAAIVDDVVLMACEAITNAIRHSDSGRPDGTGTVALVVLGAAHVMRVEVIDAGSTSSAPHVADESLDAVSGRGLHLLDVLSGGRWGSKVHDAGRTVWFEVTPDRTGG